MLLLSACGIGPVRAAPGGAMFLAPTAAQPTPEPEQVVLPSATPVPTAEPGSCSNMLTYITDVTIPDYTEVDRSVTMDKRWEVENSGTCAWDERYQIRLIAGSDYGAGQVQSLPPARSGTHTVIRLMFTSPGEPGTYKSAWQAYDPDGNPFGDPFYIVFVVK